MHYTNDFACYCDTLSLVQCTEVSCALQQRVEEISRKVFVKNTEIFAVVFVSYDAVTARVTW